MKIVITTFPFGDPNSKPLEQLEGYNVAFNRVGRKYTPDEHKQVLLEEKPEIIIAGTEKYTAEILNLVPNLKMISRVGIGVDSVDLDECRKRGIIVCNTPDAPSNAVAELVIGQMINALRHIPNVLSLMKEGGWQRYVGRELRGCDVGIIGFGRIGKLVATKLLGLKPRRIFINDIDQAKCQNVERCEFETKLQIICHCDIITIHIPYNKVNHHFISDQDLRLMKRDAVVINTSRGGIVDEVALFEWLCRNPQATAAIDTFVEEPYKGNLLQLANFYPTPHLGSCSRKSRFDMEVGATEEVANFLNQRAFNSCVC